MVIKSTVDPKYTILLAKYRRFIVGHYGNTRHGASLSTTLGLVTGPVHGFRFSVVYPLDLIVACDQLKHYEASSVINCH